MVVCSIVSFILGFCAGILVLWRIHEKVESDMREELIEQLCKDIARKLGVEYDER